MSGPEGAPELTADRPNGRSPVRMSAFERVITYAYAVLLVAASSGVLTLWLAGSAKVFVESDGLVSFLDAFEPDAFMLALWLAFAGVACFLGLRIARHATRGLRLVLTGFAWLWILTWLTIVVTCMQLVLETLLPASFLSSADQDSPPGLGGVIFWVIVAGFALRRGFQLKGFQRRAYDLVWSQRWFWGALVLILSGIVCVGLVAIEGLTWLVLGILGILVVPYGLLFGMVFIPVWLGQRHPELFDQEENDPLDAWWEAAHQTGESGGSQSCGPQA